MQLQNNLQHSLKQCHQRRLQKICSIKKRLLDNSKNPESRPLSVLTKIDNLQETKRIPKLQSSKKQVDQNIPYQTHLYYQQQHAQTASTIVILKTNIKSLNAQLQEKQIRINKLELNNKQLQSEIYLFNQKLQSIESQNAKKIENENRLMEITQSLEQKLLSMKDSNEMNAMQLAHQQQMLQMTRLQESFKAQIQLLKNKQQQITQFLKKKDKQIQEISTKCSLLINETDLVNRQFENFKAKYLGLEKQNAKKDEQLFQVTVFNTKRIEEQSALKDKINELQQTLQSYQNIQAQKQEKINEVRVKWDLLPHLKLQEHCCCEYEARFKYLEKFFQHQDTNLELLSTLEPTIFSSLKYLTQKINIPNTSAVYSLSCSFNKILGSYQEIAKPSQNQISNFIQEQEEYSSPEQHNEQQLLARMEQQVVNMESSNNINKQDTSELKENLNMVKIINQQLFHQVQKKQTYIKQMEKKLKYFQNYTNIIQHIKASIETIFKQLKNPNTKTVAILQNIKSMLKYN